MPCSDCAFWQRQTNHAMPQQQLAGQCRRLPPTPLMTVPGQPIGLPIWPITAGGEWCGEYTIRMAEVAGPPTVEEGLSARRPSHETLGMAVEDPEESVV